MKMPPAPDRSPGITVVPPGTGEAWWIATNHQQMKLTAANTGGALSLWFETIPPGGGPPPHVHRAEDEIFIVTEGEIAFESGESRWTAPSGTVVFAPRGIPHGFRNESGSVARMIVLVTPGGFDRYFRATAFRGGDADQRPPVRPEEYDGLVRHAPDFDLEFLLPAGRG